MPSRYAHQTPAEDEYDSSHSIPRLQDPYAIQLAFRGAHEAAIDGDLHALQDCIDFLPRTQRDECRIKAAVQAAKFGHLKLIETLLQDITDKSLRDIACKKSIKLAALGGHLLVVKFLLLEVDELTLKEAVILAALAGHLEIVKHLATKLTTDQTSKDLCFKDAAEWAASKGHLETYRFLLAEIADPTIKKQCLRKEVETAAATGETKLTESSGFLKTCYCLKQSGSESSLGTGAEQTMR